ncbi:glycosyltransferase family 39 protein [Aminivibrio sp.]|uniref:glycosyltransferase family 39 protein n=1 Tax=Aminivibrio sp. TaxID=1872489 RepID=UPI00345EA63E
MLLTCFFFISAGVVIRVAALLYDRSLWVDEAFLASSVVQRGYAGLLSPLDFDQGAPIGYLWTVKTFVYFFGPSEFTLRLLSFLSGLGAIGLFYILLKDAFRVSRPWVGTAFFATIPFLIYYSTEFKPYLFDGFVTLLSLYVFHLTINKRIKLWITILYCALIIWFSFPAVFTVAAFCLLSVIGSLIRRNWQQILGGILTGFVSLVSFFVYYSYFYGNLSGNQSLPFWNLLRFPLFPKNPEDLELTKAMALNYFSIFGYPSSVLTALLTLAGFIFLSVEKYKNFLLYILLTLFLLLVASWFGFYPMLNRILLFFIPLHVLFLALTMEEVNSKKIKYAISLSFLFVFLNLGSLRFILPDYVYRNNEEVAPLVERLQTHDDGIPVYLSSRSIPQYEYHTGYRGGIYDIPKKPVCVNNVIYGSDYHTFFFEKSYSWASVVNEVRLNQNARAIEKNDRAYLIMGHCPPDIRQALLTILQYSGSVREVANFRGTPLYFYEKGLKKLQ